MIFFLILPLNRTILRKCFLLFLYPHHHQCPTCQNDVPKKPKADTLIPVLKTHKTLLFTTGWAWLAKPVCFSLEAYTKKHGKYVTRNMRLSWMVSKQAQEGWVAWKTWDIWLMPMGRMSRIDVLCNVHGFEKKNTPQQCGGHIKFPSQCGNGYRKLCMPFLTF